MSSDNLMLAQRFHQDIFMQDNYDAADEILAPDFTWHMPGLPPSQADGNGLKEFAKSLRAAFPDYRITHEEEIATGNTVVIRWTNHGGTQQGAFLGIAPTGAEASAEGIDVFRIEGGRIVELHQMWDQMGVMMQLGLVSPDAIRFA